MHPTPLAIPDLLRLSAWPLAIAAAAVSLCYAAAGETLGFYLGPVMAVTVILPAMIEREQPWLAALVVAGAMVDAVGVAWLLAVFGPNLTFVQWLQCYLLLAAYAFALTALTRATAAWVTTLLAAAWLAWPLWTAPFLDITLARRLTPAHPLMAMNSVVLNYGVWMEQPLMYRQATLGQDVPYALPRSIWPCVIVHIFIGLLLSAPAWLRARSRRRRREAAAERSAAPAA